MQGYSYSRVTNAWVCHKCSALVDDPSLHEDSHQELVTVLKRWSDLLEQAKDIPDEAVVVPMYGVPETTVTDGDHEVYDIGGISDKRIGER